MLSLLKISQICAFNIMYSQNANTTHYKCNTMNQFSSHTANTHPRIDDDAIRLHGNNSTARKTTHKSNLNIFLSEWKMTNCARTFVRKSHWILTWTQWTSGLVERYSRYTHSPAYVSRCSGSFFFYMERISVRVDTRLRLKVYAIYVYLLVRELNVWNGNWFIVCEWHIRWKREHRTPRHRATPAIVKTIH